MGGSAQGAKGVLLDCAHNLPAVSAFIQHLNRFPPFLQTRARGMTRTLVFGILAGRDFKALLSALLRDGHFDHVILVQVPVPRGMPLAEMHRAAREVVKSEDLRTEPSV